MPDRRPALTALTARAEGDARLAAFDGRRGWHFGLFAAAFVALIAGGFLAIAVEETWFGDQVTRPIDFRVFWAAARLAAGGEPLAALDEGRLVATHRSGAEVWMPFLYPPGFLVLITPFGMMPFAVALILWTALSLVLLSLALRPFVAGIAPLWLGMTSHRPVSPRSSPGRPASCGWPGSLRRWPRSAPSDGCSRACCSGASP